MEDARFDALAKHLARGVTRRGVLRGLASLTGASVAGLVGRSGAVATDCASRCDRLPAGDARDQCQAACAAAGQARATAEAEANQARATAEATTNEARARAAALRACQGDTSRLCGTGTDIACCAPDETCQDGGCVQTTPPGPPCGEVGAPCAGASDCCAPNVCADGSCVASCPPGYRECDGVCYPGGCCSDADCGTCLTCGSDHICHPCEATGSVCQNGTCVPATTTTTTTSTTTTSTTTTTTPPPACPTGTTLCQGSGAQPTCCASGSSCGSCDSQDGCTCCATAGGECLSCPLPQSVCCSTSESFNTCTCCAGGQTCCDGVCADIQNDVHNCGACGHTCGANETCRGGQCVFACPVGSTPCQAGNAQPTCCASGSECTCDPEGTQCFCCPTVGNAYCIHCPAGQAVCCSTSPGTDTCTCCAAGHACCDGTCCAAGQHCCDGTCCDHACCGGACCAAGQTCCGDACSDLQTDAANCGACGHACGSGQGCCGGVCIDIQSDQQNCGACGHACPTGHGCCDGKCGLPLGAFGCNTDADCCLQVIPPGVAGEVGSGQPSLTCCAGICKLRAGSPACLDNDSCCSHTSDGSDVCCAGTCCYTCQHCDLNLAACVGDPSNDC